MTSSQLHGATHSHLGIAKRRKTYTRFSDAEHDRLVAGVKKFGIGKWKAIFNSYSGWAAGRDAVALKDRWRTLMRRNSREEPVLGAGFGMHGIQGGESSESALCDGNPHAKPQRHGMGYLRDAHQNSYQTLPNEQYHSRGEGHEFSRSMSCDCCGVAEHQGMYPSPQRTFYPPSISSSDTNLYRNGDGSFISGGALNRSTEHGGSRGQQTNDHAVGGYEIAHFLGGPNSAVDSPPALSSSPIPLADTASSPITLRSTELERVPQLGADACSIQDVGGRPLKMGASTGGRMRLEAILN